MLGSYNYMKSDNSDISCWSNDEAFILLIPLASPPFHLHTIHSPTNLFHSSNFAHYLMLIFKI
jgi:hypothetical protein